MKRVVLGAVGVLACAVGVVWAEGKNLQHYPKDMKTSELKTEMNLIKKSLGVECKFCHKMEPERDMAFDTEKKKIARSMLDMQKKLNEKCMTPEFLGMRKAPQATCYMCHHGHDEIETEPKNPDDEKKFNAAVEAGKKKRTVDAMKKLVDELNKTYFTWEKAPKATCWMCHRGRFEYKYRLPKESPADEDEKGDEGKKPEAGEKKPDEKKPAEKKPEAGEKKEPD